MEKNLNDKDHTLPLISVVMCVYNGQDCVGDAIDSIIAQTFNNYELIICDDASTDKTVSILERYEKNPKIKVLKNDVNKGSGFSRNRCISESRGDYIVIQDADDKSANRRLQVLYDSIKELKASVVGSSAILVDGDFCWGVMTYQQRPKKYEWIRSMQIVHASIIVKKADVLEVGGYSAFKKDRSEDYDLLCRIAARGKVIRSIKDPLYIINYSENDYKRRTFVSRLYEVRAKYKACFYISPPLLYYLYCLKPLVLAFMPKKIQFLIHKMIFSGNKSRHFSPSDIDTNPSGPKA
ncbi:glycosyltransferase family 2 protein [Bacteriovoracales bacterium]|nr:glycosyltransferase family 2 protein [Bacteriovoracales bacterium]